jgi:tetratricopeptide (TPR) repeat protein
MNSLFRIVFATLLYGGIYLCANTGEVTGQEHYIKKKAVNAAFSYYMETRQQGSSDPLDYAIGNTLYELEEYPWAILYYMRALENNPRDTAARENLALAREKLDLVPSREPSSLMEEILSFHHLLSFQERKMLFLLFGIAAFLAASGFIWLKNRWFYQAALLTSWVTGLLLMNITATQYGKPIEGIIIKTSALYSNADSHSPLVIKEPVDAGNKVQIINVLDQGKWLKVYISGDQWGYIPYDHVRLI